MAISPPRSTTNNIQNVVIQGREVTGSFKDNRKDFNTLLPFEPTADLHQDPQGPRRERRRDAAR